MLRLWPTSSLADSLGFRQRGPGENRFLPKGVTQRTAGGERSRRPRVPRARGGAGWTPVEGKAPASPQPTAGGGRQGRPMGGIGRNCCEYPERRGCSLCQSLDGIVRAVVLLFGLSLAILSSAPRQRPRRSASGQPLASACGGALAVVSGAGAIPAARRAATSSRLSMVRTARQVFLAAAEERSTCAPPSAAPQALSHPGA